ncbi:MAG: hypothetical protein AAGE52_38705 [Myxococcota bacterium]
MRRTHFAALLFVLPLATACGGGGDEFTRSCNGRAVPNCLPFEFSVIESASVEPEEVMVDDPTATVELRIQMMRCPDLDRNHEVTVQIRTMDEESPSIFDLLTVRDDGQDGDTMAGDGLIEKTLENPFFGPQIPADTEVFLRVQARAPADCSGPMCIGGTCRSELFEAPYRIGRRFIPPS